MPPISSGIFKGLLVAEFNGSSKGATATKEKILTKYQDVTDLIKSGNLSIRKIAKITNRSINTVRKVNYLLQ